MMHLTDSHQNESSRLSAEALSSTLGLHRDQLDPQGLTDFGFFFFIAF